MSASLRTHVAALSDAELVVECDVDTYRASGPGGQKRNKTSSAVRLRHGPSGLIVIAEESRSQHDNKAKAVKRLRRAVCLELREPAPDPQADPAFAPAVSAAGQLYLSPKDPRFWPAAGVILDVLFASAGQVSTAADALGVSTGQLISFLELDPKLWQTANQLRTAGGLKPLRA